MDAGILKEGDPEMTSVTMWAHAHGMVQLYHEGCFEMSQEEFRLLFKGSSMRLMGGVGTERFVAEMAARIEQEMEQEMGAPA